MFEQKIRDHLLKSALEEERENITVRKFARKLMIVGAVLLIPTFALIIYFNLGEAWSFIVSLPSCVSLAGGYLLRIVASKNSVMKLTEEERKLL